MIDLSSASKEKNLGVNAASLDLSKIPDIQQPEPASDGRIMVLSKYGYATKELIGPSKDFVEYASTCKLPVLDIGAAYGEATVAALKKGATVIANEVGEDSLLYIAKRKDLTDDDRKRLYLKQGFSPFGIDFEPCSLGAIHCSRVMHYFKPEDVEGMFKKAHEWLAEGGRFFLITSSPYHWVTPKGFYKVYEKKLKEGVKFPGVITDFSYRENENYKIGQQYNHSMDPNLIFRLATENDFMIKLLGLLPGRGEFDYTMAILVKKDFQE